MEIISIAYKIGIPIVLFLGGMGIIKAKEYLTDITHAKRGEFKVYRIKPNMRIVPEWRKQDKGFLVKSKDQKDKIPYSEAEGSKLFGGVFGNTPIMYIDHIGNIINFKYEQMIRKTNEKNENGEDILEQVLIRKDAVPVTSEHIDTLEMLAEAHGKLSAQVNDSKQMNIMYILVALVVIVLIIVGLPMVRGGV